MPSSINNDTIVAQATAPGKGGIGIVRLSGPDALLIAKKILRIKTLTPRYAHLAKFYKKDRTIIDEGLALYFINPHSFTAEDVVELQGHGGQVVMDSLQKVALEYGARLARPGEFSERAFLNGKIDLTQAEAIADLIESESEQAARSAINSLQGVFSKKVNKLVEALIALRIYVEAAIDFPEEEIDFLSDGKIKKDLDEVLQQLKKLISEANQGALLKEGMSVVIAGKPNAGKSSLLNSLAEKETAIVSTIAGTTRDVLKEQITIDGLPLHIIDTAGLRESPDEIEQEGIRRAWLEIEKADQVLLLNDCSETENVETDSSKKEMNNGEKIWLEFTSRLPDQKRLTIIQNKIDLTEEEPRIEIKQDQKPVIYLSSKTGSGIKLLKEHLKMVMGYHGSSQGQFIARRRHLDALAKAFGFINTGKQQLENSGAGELLAEDLRLAQQSLSEITGEFRSDDLLGQIFSSFCIGK